MIQGEGLNGIGSMIKSLMEGNLKDPKVRKKAERIRGSLVMRDPGTGVSATVLFEKGAIQIQNEPIPGPSAFVEAGFDELAEISSGKLWPMIKALIAGKVKARGNPIKLLRMTKVILPAEEP